MSPSDNLAFGSCCPRCGRENCGRLTIPKDVHNEPRKPSHSIDTAVVRVDATALEGRQENFDIHELFGLVDAPLIGAAASAATVRNEEAELVARLPSRDSIQ
jgi:hypothetical protein